MRTSLRCHAWKILQQLIVAFLWLDSAGVLSSTDPQLAEAVAVRGDTCSDVTDSWLGGSTQDGWAAAHHQQALCPST